VTLLEERGDCFCALLAAILLVVAEGEIHGSFGFEAGGRERLDGLENCHEVALVIPSAATPNKAVPDFPGEWAGVPLGLGARCNRYDILMRHQNERPRRRIPSLPGVQQAVFVDKF